MKIKIQKLFYFLYFPTLSEQQNKAKEKKKEVGVPCETPMCRHQFFGALPCAGMEPPQTPEIEKESISKVFDRVP
jgi:hypothetical protein